MKNFKKIISLSLSLALLLMIMLATPVSAENEVSKNQTAYFNSFTGIVKEIRNYVNPKGEEVENEKFVHVESEIEIDGVKPVVVFFVTEETYMITDNKLKVGSKITGFYEAMGIAPMIFPPQYRAAAIAVDLPADQSVKADRFDENFISYDNTLKLNIEDKTKIIMQDGTAWKGAISELANRKLIVIYDISTRSIPAITIPLKVIVLYEKAVAPIGIVDIESELSIFINRTKIEAPVPYINDENITMVPLRAVAEALGYEVGWIAETRTVTLDDIVSLTIGDSIILVKDESIELITAPVLITKYTYVPLELFTDILDKSIITVGYAA